MTDYLNPHRIYPDDISRRIDTPPGFDSERSDMDRNLQEKTEGTSVKIVGSEIDDLKAAVDRLAENLRDAEETINDRTVRSMVQDEVRKNIPAFNTALSALRDALRRQVGCEWCEEENLDVEYYYTLPTAPRSFQTRRNYCHKCGRPLEPVGNADTLPTAEDCSGVEKSTVSKTKSVGQGPGGEVEG